MNDLPILRAGQVEDADALLALAVAGGSGLTNLPPDRAALYAKLDGSVTALQSDTAREEGAPILFVVELGDKIVATSCVFPRVGAQWPFYSYRLTRQAARSDAIGRVKAQILLNLVNDFEGEAEVGGLLVDPAARGYGVGQLAAKGRYLFMAFHRSWFRERVIAELRGWQDPEGHSPVWDAIGRQFYDMDFQEADRTGALWGNQFIADLGPRYPLYVSLLPEAARAALGRPHDEGRPALEMLRGEGFSIGDYVDIFDGGPTVVAPIDAVRSVRDTRFGTVERIGGVGAPALIATGEGAEFRMTRGLVGEGGSIDRDAAARLGLGTGETFGWIPLS